MSTPALVNRVPLHAVEVAAEKSLVCVTGATGYIAGPIIERLLRAGHTVHATCRDPSSLPALTPLMELPGAAERLSFFKADLTQPNSFDAAVEGCAYVIHVAAPVLLNRVKRGEGRSKVVDPMLQGVENVLGAVNRSPSVRRVVMTSSISALCSSPRDQPPGHVFDARDWNATASETFFPYAYGKTLSERRAWEIAEQQSRWQLVTVLPSVVFGPTVAPCGNSESVMVVRDSVWPGLLFPAAGDLGTPVVDVRDVAAVHCLAMVTPGAHGRYIAHAHSTTMYDATHVLASRFPRFRPSLFLAPFWLVWLLAPVVGLNRDLVWAMWGKPGQFDTTRTATELGLKEWLPLADTLADMVHDMAAKGMVKMR